MNDEGSHISSEICDKLVYHFDTYECIAFTLGANRQWMDALYIASENFPHL